MSTVTLPQARIPLGWTTVNGQRTPVLIDIEWMRALLGILARTGGASGASSFEEYLPALLDSVASDPAAQEALRAVDELRNELASARNDQQTLRALLEDVLIAVADAHSIHDLRARVELIEDRLA